MDNTCTTCGMIEIESKEQKNWTSCWDITLCPYCLNFVSKKFKEKLPAISIFEPMYSNILMEVLEDIEKIKERYHYLNIIDNWKAKNKTKEKRK